MDINKLRESVSKAAEKVGKIKGTIAKHEKGLQKQLSVVSKWGITLENMEVRKWLGGIAGTGGSANYWDICQVEQKQDDIKGANRKLRDAEAILSNWQTKLNVEVEKERFLSEQAPAVIIEFLARWKEEAREWFIKSHIRYMELIDLLKAEEEDARERYLKENPNGRAYGDKWDKFMHGEKEVKRIRGVMAMMGAAVSVMATFRKENERLAWLESTLEEDRKHKLFDLITRINDVTGTITDAKGLNVSEKGNLDGIVIGDKGKAKIQTVGAGGEYIQCFHYRTLVHPIK